MACYCGISTKAAKVRWAIVAICVLTAAGLFIAFSQEMDGCIACDPDSVLCKELQHSNGFEVDSKGEFVVNCSEDVILGTYFGGILALIVSTIPCCVMCCCACDSPSYNKREGALPYAQHVATAVDRLRAPAHAPAPPPARQTTRAPKKQQSVPNDPLRTPLL